MTDNIKASNINKDTEKYRVVLKFVKSILSNIGKENIEELTQFVNIERESINSDENVALLKAMENEFFPLFTKTKSTYYKKGKNPVLNFLKEILKDIGYKMCSRDYKKQQNRIVKCTTLYTIKQA
jgi:hypothetical protein